MWKRSSSASSYVDLYGSRQPDCTAGRGRRGEPGVVSTSAPERSLVPSGRAAVAALHPPVRGKRAATRGHPRVCAAGEAALQAEAAATRGGDLHPGQVRQPSWPAARTHRHRAHVAPAAADHNLGSVR
eukprot:ctg_10.g1